MKYIAPQSIHRDFFYFYVNSRYASKKSYDKSLVSKIALLANDAFDPMVWDSYNATNSVSKKALMHIIAHFVETAGSSFADPEYIMQAVSACRAGQNLNIEFPSLFTSKFGQLFAEMHSQRYGHRTDSNFDDEFPFTLSTEEVFLPNVRGYRLSLNLQHLQKYQASRKSGQVVLQGAFFNGSVFKLLIAVRSFSGGDTLSYKFKAKRCQLTHKINGLNAYFDVTS
ncbi:hypothetical protein WKW72_02960 [Vibrio alginolyticus]|uniref:hypothetical protein n=1 Tax=Vibrio alginolyticus TaxID=663 RepID=UPI001BD1C815|nr:hypothetical protein [Vibrio alginolyticus]MBT0044371.1 hypothetical protein [Vibrio alginolyticus]